MRAVGHAVFGFPFAEHWGWRLRIQLFVSICWWRRGLPEVVVPGRPLVVLMVGRKEWRYQKTWVRFVGRGWRLDVTSFWVSVELCIDSTLVWVHNPDMDLRLRRKPEKENQRTICLPQLVGLALVEEDLGRMNKSQSITYAHTCCWNPGDGGSTVSVLRSYSCCR